MGRRPIPPLKESKVRLILADINLSLPALTKKHGISLAQYSKYVRPLIASRKPTAHRVFRLPEGKMQAILSDVPTLSIGEIKKKYGISPYIYSSQIKPLISGRKLHIHCSNGPRRLRWLQDDEMQAIIKDSNLLPLKELMDKYNLSHYVYARQVRPTLAARKKRVWSGQGDTDVRDAEIVRRYNSGESMVSIGEACVLSKARVHQIISDKGDRASHRKNKRLITAEQRRKSLESKDFRDKVVADRRKGMHIQPLCCKHRISREEAWEILHPKGFSKSDLQTKIDIETILALVAKGLTHRQIAERFGVVSMTVSMSLVRYYKKNPDKRYQRPGKGRRGRFRPLLSETVADAIVANFRRK